MASDSVRYLVIGLVLFALFGTMLITSYVGLGNIYGKSTESIGGGALNSSLFGNSVSGLSDNSESLRERMTADPNLRYEGNTEDDRGVLGIMADTSNLIMAPFTVLAIVLTNLLGLPSFFTDIIRGLLIITVILGLWRLVRIGD